MGRSLRTYRSRRDFARSPQPRGEASALWKRDGNPIFVIHQHRATTLHFDLRLEVDGALASWAVPKGPSTDPSEKRLAVRVEDHPLDYADFEGVIPADSYGAGPVIVWDAGPYRSLRTDAGGVALPLAHCLGEGKIEVWLEGRKLRGGYALLHARLGGDERHWLLRKLDDEGADARRKPASTEPRSVLTGRTLEEVAAEEGER